MNMVPTDLSGRTGLDIPGHLERQAEIPVLAGLQAQGDLIVVPLALAGDVTLAGAARWDDVPPRGVEVLRGTAGGHPHTLVAEPGTCQWTTGCHDREELALGVLSTTGPAYLIHPEHGASGIAPGTYVIRRQRERGDSARGGRLVAD